MAKASTMTVALTAVMIASAALAPLAAHADSLQTQKNNWRNGAIGAGAVTLYGLKNHQNTTTLLGAAGTAYSLSQYERKRHQQSQRNAARARWHRAHRYHHHR